MLNIFAGTHHKVRTGQSNTKNLINQAITHSMIKADDALKKEQYKDAHKFYKYALRLSEMQFGDQDSIVKNLRLLLKGIDEFLSQGAKKPQMAAEVGWRRITD
jgi:hypothetical protein